ncbi:thiol-disulfide isomerase/thioredoxin [Laceyella sediminis]|jgi:thiol-disulfide isomerase/thioredoxin|uniref:Thiol-disulfide isomerase/thioredoxin n=2 Tax=Laceyella sediminis TaxID=573074 RepID=A0ABX5ESU8_9BACL|nr:thiol-disulfide isomerase/thioredoxin [Laceyella sediminis]
MNLRNILIGIVIAIAIGGAFWSANTGQGPSMPQDPSSNKTENKPAQSQSEKGSVQRDEAPQQEMRAPNFSLKTLDGKTVEVKKNNGKPTLINFWASWCPPCKVEMPHIQKAYEKYGDRVNFLMVNLTAMDDETKMKQYLKEEGYSFPVLLDRTGEVSQMYQAISIPTTYIVDRNGIIIKQIIGAMTEDQLTEIMEQISK